MREVMSGGTEWIKHSIMSVRGEGRKRQATEHNLTEAHQGKYHYTMGPYSEPVLHIKPGDRVVVETRDAFEGKIKSETDLPTETLQMPFLNPQNGPIMVEGAEKGDAIAVYIESMIPRGPNPRGTCCMIPEFGALTGTYYTATLNDPLPEVVRKINLDEEWVYWSDRVRLPYRPHIGTLSCSPEIDSINSLTPDNHGGNMDLPDMGPGSITYLPVRTPGGRLFIGDAHACQGDGEVCGVAVEYPTVTTIRVDLIKGWEIEWPRLEKEDFIMTIGSTRPLEDAARIAYRELVRWMAKDYGFDKWDAYMMLSQCGMVRLHVPDLHLRRRDGCSLVPTAISLFHASEIPVPPLDEIALSRCMRREFRIAKAPSLLLKRENSLYFPGEQGSRRRRRVR